MNRNQLTAFVIAYENRKLVRAAEKLYVSQSAISQQLKKLEEELDTELFVHKKGEITPSEYGELFYPYAKEALAAVARGEDAIRRQKQTDRKLVIYLYSYNGESAISQATRAFQEAYPEILLELRRSVAPTEFHVAEHALYFANEAWTLGRNLHFVPLYRAHYICVMRKQDAPADCTGLYPKDILHMINYFPPGRNGRRAPLLEEIQAMLPKENLRFSPDLPTSLLNISVSGGVCICPDYLSYSQGLVGIPYCPEHSFGVGLAYVGTPTANMEKFLEYVKAWLSHNWLDR